VSPRNFQRVFTKEVGKAPAHNVQELRIEAARRKMERMQSLEEIADQCGFGSANVIGRSFHRLLQATPVEHHSRF
jgi:transcriptional regulator GlxA family with amidase domain